MKWVNLREPLKQAQVGEGFVRAVQSSLYMECEARMKVEEKHLERLQKHLE